MSTEPDAGRCKGDHHTVHDDGSAGDIEGVIQALGQIRQMSNLELLDRGTRGRAYAQEILSMEILGPKMEAVLKDLVEHQSGKNFNHGEL